MQNPVIINTTTTEAKSGCLVISYNWRSTAAKVVPDSQKHRSILIPAELILTQAVREIRAEFRGIVVDALETIASERLADFCSASMMQTTVSADLFATEALLSWNSERKALQQRLTADEVKAWASTSATVLAATQAHGADTGKAVAEQLVKLAGPNHGMTPERAAKFLSVLWQASDADHLTGLRVMLRIQGIADSTASTAGLLDSILA